MENLYSREVETTLVIQSQKPDEIVRSIAGLTDIGDYKLIHKSSRAIRDIYFDTLDGSLSARRTSLRLRELNGKCWVTMKKQGKLNKMDVIERSELEFLWSQDALERVIRELADVGIKLNQPIENPENVNPVDVLLKAGFKAIQERETHRQVRDIAGKDEFSILAEMAIDSVVYHFSEIDIKHYEIEIELREGDDEIFEVVIDKLLAFYKPYLRKWKFGKLATGRGIEKLLEDGSPDKLMDENNVIKLGSYRLLEFVLRTGN